MICPRCETPTLVSHQRGGMEVDVCSTCNGVWLDRGELERLALTPPAPASATMVDDIGPEDRASKDRDEDKRRDRDRDKDRDRDRDRDRSKDKDREKKKKKKPKSLGTRVADALDDVFDDLFDDIFD